MKNLKILLLLTLAILSSCDLDEDPPYLDETAYNNIGSIFGTLDGVYAALTTYDSQERRIFVLNGFSGFFNTRKQSQASPIDNVNNANLFSLKPLANDGDATAMWIGYYRAIARANTLIANVQNYDPDGVTAQDLIFKDVVGQAYFVRAWSYFSLVRLFGDVPLLVDLPSYDAVMNELTPAKGIYSQIIADASKAVTMMNTTSANDNPDYYYPKGYAANVLLAKVYMTMATNSDIVPDDILGSNFWQMAFDEAIQVYGEYSLLADYASLFTLAGENSSESIFELQISQIATNSQMGRNYTPNSYKPGLCFGWLTVNADIYDDHEATYPGDSRLEGATYMSEYPNNGNNPQNVGNMIRVYPSRSRGNFRNSHPFFFKYANKDITHSNQYDDKNIIVYRYADLLLMLAEISNELGDSANALNYVTEVLDRSGLANTDYANADQLTFRDKIMKEYRYELLGEGEDAHNNRRRGYNYFLNNIITPHNTNPNLNFTNLDLILSEDPTQVMFLPIPTRELNTNELID